MSAPSPSYAGDVTVDDAWSILADHPEATLVDVRTTPEWTFVGVPDLGAQGRAPVFIEWQTYPAMAVRPDFVEALGRELAARGVTADAPILFLCRSGVRSRSAAIAMTAAGFTRCLNIAGGFEGPPDGDGHRGRVDGWKARDLPWRQS